ncbi:MAG TPA: cellulose biosynthesis cyclic di-GMP-binding regulatory protein BcsB, partial [Microvirga sp.]|nr:cellulose biosynthesis cyclic di-GMP-binding regulatory protein BcsB [Microvirga sp.]
PAAPAGAGPGRFVVPEEALRLEGEMDARTWSVFLTQEEAADEAALTVAYTNAIFVMPEASRLRASLNGEVVLDAPIESPGGLRTIRVPVRRNLLRAGQNRVRFEVSQRHRTDCSVNATYELWTQLDGAATRLTFARGGARLRTLDDLPAVGADVTGTTTLRAHVPGLATGQAGSRFLRAVQAIAIRGRYQHLVVQVADQPAAGRAAGAVTLVVGTAGEIRGLVEGLPQEATSRAWAGIVADPRQGEVVVATGPSAADVDAAVETLAAPTLRPVGVIRTEVDTLAWSAPDTPLVAGERSIRLSSLDISTQEFSGRRFNTSFKIALPSDFYADAYGEAILYLDAAYATMVRPGSHLDVYVNGRITSTLALNAGRGGIFQRFPVRLTLRNFKPGVNDVTVESILLTESDAQCVPGGTVPGPNRFALFDTSDIVFPEYGRIGRHPNLSAFSASAYPYLLAAEPVPVILGRQDASHYAAAATLLAKLAHSAGRPIPVDTGVTMLSVGTRPALVIGTAGQLAPSLLPVVGVSDTIRTSWSNAVEAPSAPAATELPYDAVVERFRERQAAPQPRDPADEIPATGTEEIRDRWRQSLGGGALRREFQSFSTWVNRTFDISLTSLNLFEQTLEPFTPAPQTSVVLAQGTNPQGGAPWTVLIGRKEDALEAGVARMTDNRIWRGLSGQLSAFQLQTLRLATRAPARTEFIETRPFSLLNTRQVIANWLSTNITFYAAMLLLLCTVLGAVTSMMLRGLGRR